MNQFDLKWQKMLRDIKEYGTMCSSRGLTYKQLFGQTICHDLREGFPLTTLRKMPYKAILDEFWFDIGGHSHLEEAGLARKFWQATANHHSPDGTDQDYLIGSYGRAWRMFPTSTEVVVPGEVFKSSAIDQYAEILKGLQYNPTSRQYVLITHMPQLSNYDCPPCHPAIVFSSDGVFLDMLIMGRSWDMNMGFPIDFARYAILSHYTSSHVNLKPRYLQVTGANNHIYIGTNYELTDILLYRTPYPLPTIDEHMQLHNYVSHPAVKFDYN